MTDIPIDAPSSESLSSSSLVSSDYDLSDALQDLSPQDIDQNLVKQFVTVAQEQGLGEIQAQKLAKLYTDHCKSVRHDSDKTYQSQVRQTEQVLQQEWSNQIPQKLQLAQKGLQVLGGESALQDLQKIGAITKDGTLSNITIARMLVRLGETVDEPSFVKSSSSYVTSPRQQITQKWSDVEFQKVFLDDTHPQHNKAVKDLQNLYNNL